MRVLAVILVAALTLMPLGAWAADLVVWWEESYYSEEDRALAELVAAFERKTGKKVELVRIQRDARKEVEAALEAGRPPDFLWGFGGTTDPAEQWAYEDRLAELDEALGPLKDLFDADLLDYATLPNGRTGKRALYVLPMGRNSNYVHVWKSLLERAGFTLADIPKEWEPFWSFWCDQVQPAVRRATGRDDIYGVALAMSSFEAGDTEVQFRQFVDAYEADYVTRDGRLVIDDPEVRRKLIEAVDGYTAIYRKGCTPPDAVTWAGGRENNKRFLDQTVVMTPNDTLSIPNALKRERPDDYYENIATLEWPLGPSGEPFPIRGYVLSAMVFKDGGNGAIAEEFVRFLVAEGWLAHYLDFSAERFLPAMSALIDQPFWLDPGDPHRMASVMQIRSRPLAQEDAVASGNWRYIRVDQEQVWAKAIHRVVTEGLSPEQAVDEAIARIKQILSE